MRKRLAELNLGLDHYLIKKNLQTIAKKMANLLQNQYASVFTRPDNSDTNQVTQDNCDNPKMPDIMILQKYVVEAINAVIV